MFPALGDPLLLTRRPPERLGGGLMRERESKTCATPRWRGALRLFPTQPPMYCHMYCNLCNL